MTSRRALLPWLLATLAAPPALAQPSPSSDDGPADVYLLGLDMSAWWMHETARALSIETGLRVRTAALPMPNLFSMRSGTPQYAAEDLMAAALPFTQSLRDAAAECYFIVLTELDLNRRVRRAPFEFEAHDPQRNISVISSARLIGSDSIDSRARTSLRMHKLIKRTIGEHRLGWRPVNDPADLMHASIRRVDDIDRLGLFHAQIGACPELPRDSAVPWVQHRASGAYVCEAVASITGRSLFRITFADRPDFAPTVALKIGPGRIGRHGVTWFHKKRRRSSDPAFGRETVVPLDLPTRGFAHVVVDAANAGELEAALALLERLRLDP